MAFESENAEEFREDLPEEVPIEIPDGLSKLELLVLYRKTSVYLFILVDMQKKLGGMSELNDDLLMADLETLQEVATEMSIRLAKLSTKLHGLLVK